MEKDGTKSVSASSSPAPVVRVNKERVREMEEKEDCFILDFDPYSHQSFNLSSPSNFQRPESDLASDTDISVIAERGQVACRDFPHSRHQCLEFPFAKTPHDKYCNMCYCYVCDVAAPCTEWSEHCHATDRYASHWWRLRRERRGQHSESDSFSGSYQESEASQESEGRWYTVTGMVWNGGGEELGSFFSGPMDISSHLRL